MVNRKKILIQGRPHDDTKTYHVHLIDQETQEEITTAYRVLLDINISNTHVQAIVFFSTRDENGDLAQEHVVITDPELHVTALAELVNLKKGKYT